MQTGQSTAARSSGRVIVESIECRLMLAAGPRQMEFLDRGVVATQVSASQMFVSWRSLAQDPAGLAFNVYRSLNGGSATKLNASPLTGGTNFTDTGVTRSAANTYSYFVKPVISNAEQAASPAYTVPANAAAGPYITVPMRNIGDYIIQHVSVADLNGDGKFDYVVGRLPAGGGTTKIEAYLNDGTFLWSVDGGPNSVNRDNIEPGASAIDTGNWDGVQAYDLDGDGRAEVFYRSANGVVFGDGKVLSYPKSNSVQFISAIDGLTGAERARIQVPTDYLSDGPGGAMTAVGYLDGVHPSLVVKFKNRIGSGEFNEMILAYDFDGSTLTQKWRWDRGAVPGYYGPYPDSHNIRIVDVDQDGKDEVAEIGYVLNGDGTVKYSLAPQGVTHGDRFHIGDFDPARPGLEGYAVQQDNPTLLAEYYYDAATGQMLYQGYASAVTDNGRGDVGDVDPAYPGAEYSSFYGLHNTYNSVHTQIGTASPWPHINVQWDGDLLVERVSTDHAVIDQWNPATQGTSRVVTLYNLGSGASGYYGVPNYYGDIIGDWREEIVYEKGTRDGLVIFTTNTPTSTRLYSLAQNPLYRNDMTTKGYLQSRHTDYYLGNGMATPPTPNTVMLPSAANQPTIVSKAAATPIAVSEKTVNLSVLGGDNDGEANLSYSWTATDTLGNAAAVSFSANGTNAAKNNTATFSQAGTFIFTVRVGDVAGAIAMSNVTVVVGQTLTSVRLTPTSTGIGTDSDQQFVATGLDQFGLPLRVPPTFAWDVISGGGAVDANGNYTPPRIAGSAVVRAASGSVSATATIAFNGSTLAAPGGLQATAVSANQINLTWNDAASGEAGYVVESSTDGVNFTALVTTSANSVTHRVTELNSDKTYYFRVRTLNANGTGLASDAVSARTHQLPIAWWKLDESAGTVAANASANSLDATLRNGPTWAAGRLGNAVNFDGVDDHVVLPNDLLTTAAGSVSLWVKTSTNFGSDAMLFYMAADTYGNGNGSQSELHVNFTSAEKINLYIRGSAAGDWANDVGITSAASYANNTWHHVAATWDSAGTAYLYVDGVLVGSEVMSPVFTFANTQRTYLSRTANGTNYFKGLMDDVRLFNAPLPAEQVQQLASANGTPLISMSASATPNPVVAPSSTATLSVAGIDDGGAANVTYTWVLVGQPPTPVTYTANGTNATKTTVATFSKSGLYTFQVTATDAGGLSVSSTVNVAVRPALLSAVSRKGSGQDLPIDLAAPSPTLENRSGGPDTLVLSFSEPVQAIDGAINANEFAITNARFASATVSGVTLTLKLADVVNASRVTVSLQGLADAAGLAVAGNLSMTIRALAGDVDRSGAVNFNDFLLLQNAFGTATSGMAATDFNADQITDFNDFLLLQNAFGSVVS